jgi:hypothetical protein
MSSAAISPAIRDAPELPSISLTALRKIRHTFGFFVSLQSWFFPVHTAATTMAYLTMMNVIPGWPAGSELH